MLPTFLRIFLLSERRRGLGKRRARMLELLLGRRPELALQTAERAPAPVRPSAQIYIFAPRPRSMPAKRPPRALP